LKIGFEHDCDALAAAEIEQKIAQFKFEPFIDNSTNDQQDIRDNDQ
jgi:hypothetical protein